MRVIRAIRAIRVYQSPSESIRVHPSPSESIRVYPSPYGSAYLHASRPAHHRGSLAATEHEPAMTRVSRPPVTAHPGMRTHAPRRAVTCTRGDMDAR
jgi:hypothetical protein